MIIDKLYDSVSKNGHVCLGLDTDLSYLPKEYLKKYENIEDALFQFNKSIIDATYDSVACYKVQIAYYEAYGLKGMLAYKRTLEYVRSIGCLVIADIKRGDIANTAEMYAKAHFQGDFESDIITLSPYMGLDSINPYLNYVENKDKGLFVLVRTSNEGAKDIQYLNDENGEKIYNIVGKKVMTLGNKYLGNCGYSSIGGVMGCTHAEEGVKLRKELSKMFFLIPGYGAQGGKAEDVALYLENGNGGVVNSSRGILLAYKKYEDGSQKFAEYARLETLKMKEDILKYVTLDK
ncbi:MAG: orotidine-5'-phosphate decarboxylase [Clostridiaceae bacterium]|nr:orotidine-5'-phosphate decarboxylase [Clostridiaceae bacterium]